MKFKNIFLLFIIFSFTACFSQSSQNENLFLSTITVASTKKITQTPIPTIATITSTPRSTAEATLQAVGITCEPPARNSHAALSPNELWISIICIGNDGEIGSHLRVVNIQSGVDWSIYFGDYAEGKEYYSEDAVFPFHWSADGKYLYATSASRISGCCWIDYYLFLVRLNLENGQQTEIMNYVGDGVQGVSLSISSSERYISYIPQDFENNLHIMDLYTWEQKVIQLEDTGAGAGHILMSSDERKIILVLRYYPEGQQEQGGSTFGAIVLIDIENGLQQKLLSGIDYNEIPIPISWQDDETVLLQKNDSYWLLSIKTAEMIQVEKP